MKNSKIHREGQLDEEFSFVDLFYRVRRKIEEIAKLPGASAFGDIGPDFEGISVKDGKIVYQSSTYRPSRTEYHFFYVPLGTLHQPSAYFEALFKSREAE